MIRLDENAVTQEAVVISLLAKFQPFDFRHISSRCGKGVIHIFSIDCENSKSSSMIWKRVSHALVRFMKIMKSLSHNAIDGILLRRKIVNPDTCSLGRIWLKGLIFGVLTLVKYMCFHNSQ